MGFDATFWPKETDGRAAIPMAAEYGGLRGKWQSLSEPAGVEILGATYAPK